MFCLYFITVTFSLKQANKIIVIKFSNFKEKQEIKPNVLLIIHNKVFSLEFSYTILRSDRKDEFSLDESKSVPEYHLTTYQLLKIK